MKVKTEEYYDASTDEECGDRSIGNQMMPAVVAVKKEEDVDTDDELLAVDDAEKGLRTNPNVEGGGKQRRRKRTFEERLEELTANKVKHGHLNVKRSKNGLDQFCWNLRQARKGRGSIKLDEERIAALDALGFDWAPKRQQNKRYRSFQERLEELKAYKAKHGHLVVKRSEDKSLANFCQNLRSARRGTGGTKLTEDRIASLDSLRFDWGKPSVAKAIGARKKEEDVEGTSLAAAGQMSREGKAAMMGRHYTFCSNTVGWPPGSFLPEMGPPLVAPGHFAQPSWGYRVPSVGIPPQSEVARITMLTEDHIASLRSDELKAYKAMKAWAFQCEALRSMTGAPKKEQE